MKTAQQKTALITGITGQDGSYLAEFLLAKGYIVHGIKRRASSFNTQRLDHIYQDPRTPHAVAKLYAGSCHCGPRTAIHGCRLNGCRSKSGMTANRCIKSQRRGETFVTRKITRGLANISQGLQDCLYMGNIEALRDWGHAKDYVRMQLSWTNRPGMNTPCGADFSLPRSTEVDPSKAKQHALLKANGYNVNVSVE